MLFVLIEVFCLLNGDVGVEKKMERKVMKYVVDKFVIDGVYLFLLFVFFF